MSHADDHAGDHGTTRRDFLYYATAGAGAVAAGAAGWTLINQMNPSADVQALSSIQVDISGVAEGTTRTFRVTAPKTPIVKGQPLVTIGVGDFGTITPPSRSRAARIVSRKARSSPAQAAPNPAASRS